MSIALRGKLGRAYKPLVAFGQFVTALLTLAVSGGFGFWFLAVSVDLLSPPMWTLTTTGYPPWMFVAPAFVFAWLPALVVTVYFRRRSP